MADQVTTTALPDAAPKPFPARRRRHFLSNRSCSMRWPDRYHEWRRRFAIVPVLIGDEWVWLEWFWIQRCGDANLVSLHKPEEADQ